MFGPYYEGNICVFLSRAKRFALQTKIIILRTKKKIAIKYYTIEIKIICIPSFEKKKKWFGDIFFVFAK